LLNRQNDGRGGVDTTIPALVSGAPGVLAGRSQEMSNAIRGLRSAKKTSPAHIRVEARFRVLLR
jgi:hypothetical protein